MSKDTKICPHCNAEGYTHTKGHSFGVYPCYTTFNMYSGETVARDPVCEGRERVIDEILEHFKGCEDLDDVLEVAKRLSND